MHLVSPGVALGLWVLLGREREAAPRLGLGVYSLAPGRGDPDNRHVSPQADWQGGAVYQLGLAEGYGLETLILPSWVSPQDAWASSQHGGWFPRVSTRWMCRAIFFLT